MFRIDCVKLGNTRANLGGYDKRSTRSLPRVLVWRSTRTHTNHEEWSKDYSLTISHSLQLISQLEPSYSHSNLSNNTFKQGKVLG